jgi:hypothetical protein
MNQLTLIRRYLSIVLIAVSVLTMLPLDTSVIELFELTGQGLKLIVLLLALRR